MKKYLIIITMIFLFFCAIYVGLYLWISIEGVKVGSFDWFPKEDDIAIHRFIWLLFAIFTSFLEVCILCIEVFLYKKLKRAKQEQHLDNKGSDTDEYNSWRQP